MRGRQLLQAIKDNAPIVGATVKDVGTNIPTTIELARNRPTLKSAIRREGRLIDAFDQHVDDVRPGASVPLTLHAPVPEGETFLQRANQVSKEGGYYGTSTAAGTPEPFVSINPNADRALFAHELGHLASQQTDVGYLASSLRNNPKLKQALLGAMLTLPGVAAAVQEGDNDMNTSIALAALASAPTLIDEGLATKHGLAILDKAGLRADLGQRGRLAGNLLNYLAPAVIAGAAGNVAGNLLD